MEQGHEGDEIILFSFNQNGCQLGELSSLDQINVDQLIDMVSRTLFLVTDGEVKFPLTLPANIASRHRICTDIASKIKDLGFSGDCGYNQLLYPSPAQTRTLLTWMVQKLPRF
jgi:coiled-coil domain-containing protein 22